MKTPRPLPLHRSRGAAFRNAVLSLAVIGAVGIAGAGGYLYYRNNSAGHLAQRAQLALEQHDPARAVDYLQRALKKHPDGETGIGLRLLMARAMLDQEREADAREYLYRNIEADATRSDSLDLLVRTYVNPVYSTLRKRPKPLSPSDARDICRLIDENLAAFEGTATHPDAEKMPAAFSNKGKLPDTARNMVGRAELHRLYYSIARNQNEQALAQLDAATLADKADEKKEAQARIQAASQAIADHREQSRHMLEQALKLDPAHPNAGSYLAQYLREDARDLNKPELYERCVSLYNEIRAYLKSGQARPNATLPEEVALNAARALQENAASQPDRNIRADNALHLLDEYLADHPDSVRASVLKGDILLDQKKIAEATAIAEKLDRDGHKELFAQVLLVNCRLAEHNTREALLLLGPLTTSYDNRPEVWYFLGLAHADAGNLPDAENAFRKSLALSPGFTEARKALLSVQERRGMPEAAAATAAEVLRESRFDYTALKVTVDALERRGQIDRAQQMLINLAHDNSLTADDAPNLARLLARVGKPEDAQKLLGAIPQGDPRTLFLHAYMAARNGNLGAARDLMARAVKADPADVEMRLYYAELLAASDLAADFRAQNDAIVASGNNLTAPQRTAVARNYLRVRQPARAIEVLKPLLEGQSPIPEAQTLAQDAQNMLAGAPVGQASASLNVQQATTDDLLRQAAAFLRDKKYDDALTTARAAIAKDKAVSRAHQLAALAHAGRKEADQAVSEAVAAATLDPNNPEPYRTFVSLFASPEAAHGALGLRNKFETINAALGYWTMGQLAEKAGQPDVAAGYYTVGLEATTRLADPRTSRETLYRSLQALHAQRKDTQAIARAADSFNAMEGGFSPTARLVAAEKLLAVGDRDASGKQLDQLASRFSAATPPALVLMVASAWLDLEQPTRALALVQKQVDATPEHLELLDGYARLLARVGNADKALEIRTKLCTLSPGDPKLRIALAEAQAAAGDVPAARRTLDEAAGLGAAGKQFAEAARLRLDIAMGLLSHAGEELKKNSATAGQDDAASMLAVSQALAALKKNEEARKMAAAIPSYAVEYPAAQVLIAAIDTEKGDYAAAIKSLNALSARDVQAAAAAAPQLFFTLIRSGDPNAALELANRQRADYEPNSPQARYWTTFAATAAREGRKFDDAIALLNGLDAEARQAAAFDIALMQVLQNKPATAALADDAPAFNRTTFALLAGKPADAAAASKLLASGLPSSVFAALSTMPANALDAALPQLARNPNLFPGDVEALVRDLGANAGPKLRTIALAQRLLEAGWSTTALDTLAPLEKDNPSLAYVAVQRHQALTDLHRTKEAAAVRDALAARASADPSRLPPSVRVLLAASWAKEERYQDAIIVLQPLTAGLVEGQPAPMSPRRAGELLTTLASLHEKLGALDQAVKLHTRVRTLDPDNLEAANNLAYTLAASKPTDKAALAQARQAVEFAISKAPNITAFQDTLGWIQILSGETAEGTRRIARAIPSLRLDPAVHYHLGVGYARLGQNDLAKLHLENVAHLAQDKKNVPELPLATEALRSLASTR
jgi:tetratricopeptide (TPR) repeat protein